MSSAGSIALDVVMMDVFAEWVTEWSGLGDEELVDIFAEG